ncbi:MAG: heparinase II/III family protein, partial [Acidobacteria bacterium]|nr:heparinase II/III family protein [Acidobacteriota bacterium]
WSERPRATLRDWRSTGAFDYADAEHAAFRRLGGAVVHRRRVVFVKPRYWVIADEVLGEGEHKVEIRFQFAAIDVSVDDAPWARARGRAGHALLVRPFAAIPLDTRTWSGAHAPMQGWISDEFGRREPAPVLVYTAVAPLPLRIITVLLPTTNPDANAAPISALCHPGQGDTPVGVAFENGESVQFDDLGVHVTAPGVFPAGPDVILPASAR